VQAPMMMSAVACIVGNLAYCLSYDAKSLTLLIIARLITGFGNPPPFPPHPHRPPPNDHPLPVQ